MKKSKSIDGYTDYTGAQYNQNGTPEKRYFFTKDNWIEDYYVEYITATKTFLACIDGVSAPECVEEKTLLAAVSLVDDWNA